MARASILGEELSLRTTEEMLEQLITDHETVVRNMRNTAHECDDLGDMVTHDLLVKRMAFHEKAIWMLRAIAAD
jgi:starvation-inducible DNA-binding protein